MAGFLGGFLRPAPVSGYGAVRVALAAILFAAAGLKCHQLATSPVVGDGLLDSRWVLMATVEFELFFGLWLLANLLPKWTHRAAVSCFGLFAAVSLYKALSGYASCGCFGRVEVNPWYTFTLDAAAVLSLLRCRPLGTAVSTQVPSRLFVVRPMAVMIAWLSVGLPAAVAIGTYQPAVLAAEGVILGDGNLVILEPEKWIGKRFPLLPFIEDVPGSLHPGEQPLRERLSEGDWIVVLHHYDCPECQEAMPQCEELARQSAQDSTAPRVALIEVPPYGDREGIPLPRQAPYAAGQFSKEKEWFVATPLQLALREALVSSATGGKDAPLRVALKPGIRATDHGR